MLTAALYKSNFLPFTLIMLKRPSYLPAAVNVSDYIQQTLWKQNATVNSAFCCFTFRILLMLLQLL